MRNRNTKTSRLIAVPWVLAVGVCLSGVFASAQTRIDASRSDRREARVTVTGTVDEVRRHACSPTLLASEKENTRSPYCATTEVLLTTKDGLVNVSLGPTKFIRDHHFFFVNGDQLAVVGFLVPSRGRSIVVPDEVIQAKRDLILRDPNGRPLWGTKAQNATIPAPKISKMPKPSSSLTGHGHPSIHHNGQIAVPANSHTRNSLPELRVISGTDTVRGAGQRRTDLALPRTAAPATARIAPSSKKGIPMIFPKGISRVYAVALKTYTRSQKRASPNQCGSG